MLNVTGWGLATYETAKCFQLSEETCYLHLQTQNDWSHVTAKIRLGVETGTLLQHHV
jgi:hypothetical protein